MRIFKLNRKLNNNSLLAEWSRYVIVGFLFISAFFFTKQPVFGEECFPRLPENNIYCDYDAITSRFTCSCGTPCSNPEDRCTFESADIFGDTYTCQADTQCAEPAIQCSSANIGQCGGECPLGYMCTEDRLGNAVCILDPENCTTTCGQIGSCRGAPGNGCPEDTPLCTASGCGADPENICGYAPPPEERPACSEANVGVCGTGNGVAYVSCPWGYECRYDDRFGYACFLENTCPVGACSVEGACNVAAGCSDGYRCINGGCTCDYSCGATPECEDLGPPISSPSSIVYTPFRYEITDFGGLMSSVSNILYPVAIAFGLFMNIRAGYKYMTSEGDPAKVKEAQEELTAAIVGTIFILLSVFILNTIIDSILGV